MCGPEATIQGLYTKGVHFNSGKRLQQEQLKTTCGHSRRLSLLTSGEAAFAIDVHLIVSVCDSMNGL